MSTRKGITFIGRGRILLAALAVALAAATAGPAALAADAADATARQILTATGVQGGLIVHIGCGDGRLTAALRASDAYLVQGLDTDAAQVEAARRHIQSLGLGGKVSAVRWDGKRLPYVDNFAALVVAEGPTGVPDAELLRILRPLGVAYVKKGGAWTKTIKPWPDTIDQWTHYLYDATGNPVSHDSEVGPPRQLRWVGGPPWARHHDHMASMTSLVSANGRLFYILDEGPAASIQLPADWHLTARDAFNGVILWKRAIDQWNTQQWPLKSGPAHLLRRLVAVGDRVFVTLSIEAPVTALDAATGQTVHTYAGSERTREILVSDGMLLALVGLEPEPLLDWRRRDTYVWANSNRANKDWAWDGTKRRIAAYDAASGRPLWQGEHPVAPCSLAADAKRIIFYDGEKVVCLGRADGKPLWSSEPIKASMPVPTSTGPRTLLWQNVVLFAGNTGQMTALAADTGKTLWEGKHLPSGHQSLKDLFVVSGTVYTGQIAGGSDSGQFIGYNPVTGKVETQFMPDVKIYWFHHRCYPSKATDRYLLTSRNGIEFIDPKAKHWETHHWVRGGCIYGVMPCNGMVYAPMQSCGCYLESKLNGFNALAAGPVPTPSPADLADAARLERGPAYGPAGSSRASPAADAGDWPTYRHDAARSGSTSASVPAALKQAWHTRLGGRLSPPVVAGGRVYVSAIDAQMLHALDAATGRTAWTFAAGGRIDSPPTIYQGLVLFGCMDGYVYALRADDGQLAWRYRAAPMDRQTMAWEQVESVWPVHGSVLVRDGVLYCTAGRSIYLDGGIRFLRLDPATGRKLGETIWDERDPETGENMQMYVKGLTMPVALSDVLSADGEYLYMRSQKIKPTGERLEFPVEDIKDQPAEGSHLFCQIGFLDDSWFHRSFWSYGRRVTGGYGGWFQAGRYIPSGRILAFDDQRVYGYGRKPQYYTNASVLEYHLFAADKHPTPDAIVQVGRADGKINKAGNQRNANSSDWKLRTAFEQDDLTTARFRWDVDQPSLQVRAMVAGGDHLVVAGHPDFIDERRAFRLPDDPQVQNLLKQQADALAGKHGGRLWVISKTDGRPVARYRLDTPPVFDGMAAVPGRLIVCTMDGEVRCLAADGATPLAPVAGDEPLNVISDEPKDVAPVRVPDAADKSADFTTVTGCDVVESKLGYRIVPAGNKALALALHKLPKPLTGKAAFRTQLLVPAAKTGLTNGYIAFGDGTDDGDLVKCGIRFKPQKAMIAQGPLAADKGATGEDVDATLGKAIDLTVQVDLASRQVTFTAGGATVTARLARPMKTITHVGFCTDSAVAEFSPLQASTP